MTMSYGQFLRHQELRNLLRKASISPVTSILVIAQNGSLLSSYHENPPSIRCLRTMACTYAAAFTSQNSDSPRSLVESRASYEPRPVVYESLTSKTLTIVTPIADNILIAVTGHSVEDSSAAHNGPQHSHHSAETSHEARDGRDTLHNSYQSDKDSDVASRSSASTHQTPHQNAIGDSSSSFPQHQFEELESIAHELSSTLRNELNGVRWPSDL